MSAERLPHQEPDAWVSIELYDELLHERDQLARHLRDAPLGGDGSHWADCWRSHIDCAGARIQRLEEQLEAAERALRDILSGGWEGPNELSRAGWIAKLALQGEYPVEPGSFNESFVSNPATEAWEPGAAIPVPGVSTDDVGCVPGSEASDPARKPLS